MKRAVMYGAGNIGRGFIGSVLSRAGYEVIFVDVAEPLVGELQRRGAYPVRQVTSHGFEDVMVSPVTAIHGNDVEAVAEAIAGCDLMATAVGARILPYIAGNLAAGLRKRWERSDRPLNIIICENLMDANRVLGGLLREHLNPQEQERMEQTVGLVEASIGRMVPVQTEEMKDGDPLRVCVEPYGFLPTDADAFKGAIPEIPGMVPFAPFDFYIKRKLYLHNMGHATCAYLGDLAGLPYIWQAIDHPEIRILTEGAMEESLLALSRKYGVAVEPLMLHKADLLCRFTNRALGDTCARVGADPSRKLAHEDRLIGSALLAHSMGIVPASIAVGIAAGLRRLITEAGGEYGVESCRKALCEVSGLESDHPLMQWILPCCEMLQQGKTLTEIRRAVDAAKGAALRDIV